MSAPTPTIPATGPTPAPLTRKAVQKDRAYRVELARPLVLGRHIVYPGQPLTLRGDALLTHWEAVRHADPV
jgi:hypothetical protein